MVLGDIFYKFEAITLIILSIKYNWQFPPLCFAKGICQLIKE